MFYKAATAPINAIAAAATEPIAFCLRSLFAPAVLEVDAGAEDSDPEFDACVVVVECAVDVDLGADEEGLDVDDEIVV